MTGDQYTVGKDGFVWFIGVVEDRQDPEQLGRLRVRCFGYHTENKELIPTAALPWAHIVQPPNLPASYTAKEGDMVFGFFLDANSAQLPMIVGVIPGKPSAKPDASVGFADPNGKYPTRIGESTFSRLARGAKYPYSYVHETESGHTFELDDNGKGRIKLSHNNGTYVEFDTEGNQINVVKKNNKVTISGDDTVSVGGNCKLSVGGDMTLSVTGSLNIKAAAINMVSGAINMQGSSFGVDAAGAINISSGAATKIKSSGVLSMDGTMTTLSGGVVDVAGALVNIQMGSPETPDALDIPDFEADILADAASVAGVSTGGGFLDGLKGNLGKVLDTVQTVVDTVQAVKSGNYLGALGGLSQLNPAIGKSLGPLTETIDKVQGTLNVVTTAVNDALTVVDSVGVIIGKDLYPKTSFLRNTLGELNSVSYKVDEAYYALSTMADGTYDLHSQTSAMPSFRESVATTIYAVDNTINTYNEYAKPNQKIATVASRVNI
jgi:hypothetical protein